MPAISPSTIKATTLTGTLSTAAQPNVTSLGTLTSLTVSGTITGQGRLVLATGTSPTAAGQIGYNAIGGLYMWPTAGSSYDWTMYRSDGNPAIQMPSTGIPAFAYGLTVSAGTTAVQALTATTLNTTALVSMSRNGQALTINNSAAAGANTFAGFTRDGTAIAYFGADASDDFVIRRGSDAAVAVTVGRTTSAVTFAAGITATTGTFSGVVILPNNVALQGRDTPGLTPTNLIKLNASNQTEVGVSTNVSLVRGSEVRFNDVSTTASAANAFLDSANNNALLRSTSSLRYKDVTGELSLAEAWRLVEGAKAITYTPKEGGREHIGLAAEWMHDLDPRVTTVDAEGRPDWVQYPHLTAPLMVALADVKRRMEAAGLWN